MTVRTPTNALPCLWTVGLWLALIWSTCGAGFDAEIAAFEKSDQNNPPPRDAILFLGSSSIRLWKTLAQDLPEYRVINRGFGGSQIADSIQHAERIVIPYAPKIIVFYAGGNDINAGKGPETVLTDFKAFVAKVRSKLPNTHIAFISIAGNPARWAQVDHVREANRLIQQFSKTQLNLSFIEAFSEMLGPDGQPRPDIFSQDRLHMNERGYELWTKLVRKHLTGIASASGARKETAEQKR